MKLSIYEQIQETILNRLTETVTPVDVNELYLFTIKEHPNREVEVKELLSYLFIQKKVVFVTTTTLTVVR